MGYSRPLKGLDKGVSQKISRYSKGGPVVVAESHVGLSRGSGDRILNRCDAATSSLKCRFETSFLRLIPDLAGCSRLEAATKVSNVETGHSPRLPRVASRFQLFESHRSNPSTCRKGNRKNKYFSTCLQPASFWEFGSTQSAEDVLDLDMQLLDEPSDIPLQSRLSPLQTRKRPISARRDPRVFFTD